MGNAEKLDASSVDPEQTRLFLARLGSEFSFQTFDDTGRHRTNMIRVLHGSLAQHAAMLAQLNALGAGVFVMVNAGDGKARKARNVQRVRACFADLDGAPLAPVLAFPLQPHIVVESSPGRWHAYWLTEGTPLAEFKPMQRAIAHRFGSDPKVCDLPRVMRLPGFFHRKAEPFVSRLIKQHDAPAYSHAEMIEAFGLALPEKQLERRRLTLAEFIPEGERNSELFKLARGLVYSGLNAAAVRQRIQKINAERCQPPLCITEVNAIAASASAYGSQGFVMVPHALLDSRVWKELPPATIAIVLDAYRQLNCHNNGRLALPWSDFKGRHGMMRSATFYQFRARAVYGGVLIQTAEGEITQHGKQPARFAIAPEFLPSSLSTLSVPSASNAQRAPKNINKLEVVEVLDVPSIKRNTP
jgi:hypothetical protein